MSNRDLLTIQEVNAFLLEYGLPEEPLVPYIEIDANPHRVALNIIVAMDKRRNAQLAGILENIAYGIDTWDSDLIRKSILKLGGGV